MAITLPGGETAVLAAVQALPFGVATTYRRGIVTWANAAFAQLTGCTPEDLVGKPVAGIPLDDLLGADPSSAPWCGPTVCRRKTGETYAGELSVTTLRSSAGEVTGFWIVKRSATDAEREGGAPNPADVHLSALIESTQDLIWSVDLNFRLLTFNRALRDGMKRSFGVVPAVGMRPDDFLPSPRVALWPPMYRRALVEGPFRVEHSLPDGRTLELLLNPILHNGEKMGISVFGKDITERKGAEARLQAQHDRFERIIENTDAGYFRIGLDGRYEDVNPAWLRMHGFQGREEAIGLHFADVQVPADAAQAAEVVAALLRGEPAIRSDFSRQRRDGTVGYHRFSANPVFDDGRVVGIEGFIVDISDWKMAEQE